MNDISHHAGVRAQQRAVPPMILDWLLDYGNESYDHHGGVIYAFTKRSRHRIERVVGSKVIKLMSPWMNAYVVCSARDGKIITIGRRVKPFRSN